MSASPRQRRSTALCGCSCCGHADRPRSRAAVMRSPCEPADPQSGDGASICVYQSSLMQTRLHTEADLDAALAALVQADARFTRALATAGRPPLRKRPDGFAGLAAIVVAQQLSTASASAIWERLKAALDPLDHTAVLRARSPKLVRVGLSAPKIRTLKAIARAVDDGVIDLPSLANMPADDAHRALTALHGIGPWTADIYLLFCLGHADAWPAGDLALQEAARLLLGLKARPSAKEMGPLAERWRPWRGAAACALWAYYRAMKKREGALTANAAPPKSPSLGRPSPRKLRPLDVLARMQKLEQETPWLNSTDRGSSRVQARRVSSWCSCMAMARTATTSSISAAPGRACCRRPRSCRRTRPSLAARRRRAGNGSISRSAIRTSAGSVSTRWPRCSSASSMPSSSAATCRLPHWRWSDLVKAP